MGNLSDLSTDNAIHDPIDKNKKANVNLKDNGEYGLEVIAEVKATGTNTYPCFDNTIRYYDMGVAYGGVARATTIGSVWTDIYSATGSGKLIGFLATFENGSDKWKIRVVVDGVDIFNGTTGLFTGDFKKEDVYNLDLHDAHHTFPQAGVALDKDTFRFTSDTSFPICFNTSIAIKAYCIDAGGKRFRAGMVTVVGV